VLPTITIDIGTTSVKLCLFDAEAQLSATRRLATPTQHDEFGEVYDLPALREGVDDFIRSLGSAARASVARIAITGVGESGGLVRSDLSLASPMILWHDQRGAEYLERLSPEQRSLLYRITGLPANGNYALTKIAWAADRATDPDDAQWLNVAEYLAAAMTGERWSEPSLASRTMALDLTTGAWSAEATRLVGLDPSILPFLRRADRGTPITGAFAASSGLDPDVRVHVAGHDHMVGAAGADLAAGELLNSTGTTEGLLFRTSTPRLDERSEAAKLANGLDCAGDGFTLFASIPTGGSAFATLQSMLGVDEHRLAGVVDRLFGRYIAGSIALDRIPLVVPRFRGSPPPAKSSADLGVVAGIRTDTSMDEIVFGTFLGMTLQFRDVLDLFPVRADRVKVIGPASANLLWLQLKADLLGTPLTASRLPEVVSRGAQALASRSRRRWADNDPFTVDPDDTRHRRLREWFAQIRAAWDHLKALPR